MREVLVITYYLPPRPSIGSNRLGGLAKYLGNFGWKPIFLTPELEAGEWDPSFSVVETPFPFPNLIKKYREQVLPEIEGHGGNVQGGGCGRVLPEIGRGHGLNLKGILISTIRPAFKPIKEITFYPDEYKTWIPSAIQYGTEILKERDISAIISSSGPVSTHLIANNLSKEFNIPWIADFRDLWTQNHYYRHSNVRKRIEQRLEKRTMKAATSLVTVSQPLAEHLQQLHSRPTYAIPNGFDPDEVREFDKKVTHDNKFIITYTGKIYDGKQDPTPLFEVISQLLKEERLTREEIEVRIYGPYSKKIDIKVNEMGLKDVVIQNGMVDRTTAIQKQHESSVLFLLNWNDPAEEGVYTGKVFEYLAARRPILAIGGPGGVVKELLDQTKTGFHVNDIKILKKVLLKWYEEYTATGRISYNPNNEAVNQYSHVAMAEKFAELLNKYVEDHGRKP